MIDINRGEILQNNSRVHPFWLHKERRNFEELKAERVDEKLRKDKGKAHPCTGTEALYRPYGPYGE